MIINKYYEKLKTLLKDKFKDLSKRTLSLFQIKK